MPDTPSHREFDLDLSERDILALNSADALAGFFARLGYNTNSRTAQTPGNLGIATETTLRPIRRIELIADNEALFQVYLFELSSITVTHTRALARAFRNRAGNFLLVLTTGSYEQIDFVLLEKYLPTAAGASGIGERQVGVRPRVLTVERRKPGRLQLRVLKRFSWTEADPIAQYEKLLSAYAVADWSEEHFNNRALFSDYYLLERLREFPEWREDPKPVYKALRDLYRGAAQRVAGKPEAALRGDLLEPALSALGFRAEASQPTANHAEPDYLLYSGADNTVLGLLLAYPWGRSLDGKDDQRDKETSEENPGAVVVSLLEKNEAPWVIVTNGKLWRLYAKQTHSRATNYYELDLGEVLAEAGPVAADPAEAFRYFWLLFRSEAFVRRPVRREGKEVNLCLLDRLLLDSEDYAKELGSRLKERVFEDIFPHLAQGFVADMRARNAAAEISQNTLDAVFQGTLTLLYRALFLLYAEARDLLPVKEVRGYHEASLAKLKREIAEQAGDISDEVEAKLSHAYRDDSYGLYGRLERLFRVIDHGDATLNVPFYNGGLFLTEPEDEDDTPEAAAARFLRDHKVPDRHLTRAIDLLARDVDSKLQSLVFIDYKSLGVRQLGSMYEGLLEFKLRVAEKKLAIVKEKGREVYQPFLELGEREKEKAEKQNRIVRKGAIYLENDKRERKATGSYYTPDYIVEYIVEHAVGPVLDEKFEAMRPKLREAQAARRAFQARVESFRKKGITLLPHPGEIEKPEQALVDELFDIKVLDPAMGSGHFLVEAVDYITDRMLTFLNAFPSNPVQAHLERMRDTILKEAEDQGITLDPARLTDVNLLKRHVLKRCIYGVDLNPMAVELAKVSLWLDCFTLGAPLSFLDHHLRCGNSLIGVTVKEVQDALEEKQGSLFGSRFAGLMLATDLMRHVGELSDITGAQVRQSRAEYRKAQDALAPFKRILDVYTSQWFGNGVKSKAKRGQASEPVAITFLKSHDAEALFSPSPLAGEGRGEGGTLEKISPEFRPVAQTAFTAAAEKRFFHWELEFPEVFYGPRVGTTQTIARLEGAGFDAVVGNPPYVRVQEVRRSDPVTADFLSLCYRTAFKNFDIYLPFFELGLSIAKDRVAYIAPNKWFATDYGQGLRKLVAEQRALAEVVDFKDYQVFADAINYTCVLTLSRLPQKEFVYVDASSGEIGRGEKHEAGELSGDGKVWSFGSSRETALLRRLLDGGHPTLADLLDRAFQGLRTSDNDVYVLHATGHARKGLLPVFSTATGKQHEIEVRLLKPLLSGDEIRAFSLTHSDQWILFPYQLSEKVPGLFSEKQLKSDFPNGWAYLKACEQQLRARERGRMDRQGWWAFGRNQNLDQFEQPKIMLPDYRDAPAAALDMDGRFYSITAYCLTLRDQGAIGLDELASLLNSTLLFWVLKRLGTALQGGFVRFMPQYLDKLPIALLSDRQKKLLQSIAERGTRNGYEHVRTELDQLVYSLYDLTADEIAIVEGRT